MFKVSKTELEGVYIIDPPTNFTDFRGSYVELYNERLYKQNGIFYTIKTGAIQFAKPTFQLPSNTSFPSRFSVDPGI